MQDSTGNAGAFEAGDAESDALAAKSQLDPGLAMLLSRWPALSPAAQAAIIELVERFAAGSDGG